MVLESAMQNQRERVERRVSVHANVSVCVCVGGGGLAEKYTSIYMCMY